MTVLTKLDGAQSLGAAIATGLDAGSNVRTPCGERRVEFLRPGDMIVTRSDGLQVLRHVFTCTITEALARADPSLAPIRLASRAIGPMMPQRELVVAPGHKVLVPSHAIAQEAIDVCCFVSARSLTTMLPEVEVVEGIQEMTYYNLVFDAHQVFTANGAPVESYRPDGAALAALERETRDSMIQMFPDLKTNPNAYPHHQYRTLAETEASPAYV